MAQTITVLDAAVLRSHEVTLLLKRVSLRLLLLDMAYMMEVIVLLLRATLLRNFVRVASRMQGGLILRHKLLLEVEAVLWRMWASKSGP